MGNLICYVDFQNVNDVISFLTNGTNGILASGCVMLVGALAVGIIHYGLLGEIDFTNHEPLEKILLWIARTILVIGLGFFLFGSVKQCMDPTVQKKIFRGLYGLTAIFDITYIVPLKLWIIFTVCYIFGSLVHLLFSIEIDYIWVAKMRIKIYIIYTLVILGRHYLAQLYSFPPTVPVISEELIFGFATLYLPFLIRKF